MRFHYFSTLFLLLSHGATTAQITRTECEDQGGEVIGDIGNGAVFQPGYLCDNTGEAPTDTVIPDDAGDGPFATDGEVCCGGTGSGITTGEGSFGETECTQDSDCPPINCFAAPCDLNVCNGDGVCELVPPTDADTNSGTSQPTEGGDADSLPTVSRDECLGGLRGFVIGDIGDGAIFKPDYICEASGEPPVAVVVAGEGEPIAVEGEVCCGPSPENDRGTATREQCTGDLGGVIVGDIGDGSIFASNYICESNGEPPLADIVPGDGETEPVAIEGEVCCGQAAGEPAEEQAELHSAAGKMSLGSVVAATVLSFGTMLAWA